MAGLESASRVFAGLRALGPRRLIALAVVGALSFGLVVSAGMFLGRPGYEMLYTGLDTQDVSRIGAALEEAGMSFDVTSQGDAVMVPYGQAARARMLLAERGLPSSANSGYELFDQLGSLGLTSFMQEITRVRALEGEIGRTIQMMRGVRAARVHIVFPNPGSFRAAKEKPSASVVIRTTGGDSAPSAEVIRHLVAAAIPGMAAGDVTVLNTDGTLLASTGDGVGASAEKTVSLERTVGLDIQEKISKTLAPYLGIENFQVSVAAKLNTDKKQVSETIFDPESRVERSVRSIKENGEAKNARSEAPVSVSESIPDEATGASKGQESSEKQDRREETTNYELSSKTVSTTSEGYAIERLSIAVVVNKARLAATLGEGAGAEAIAGQLKELEALIASSAGVSTSRGDMLKVTAVDFLAPGEALEPSPAAGLVEAMGAQLGTLINAAVILVITVLVMVLAVRPALKLVAGEGRSAAAMSSGALALPPGAGGALPDPLRGVARPDLIADLTEKMRNLPQHRLEQMVKFDEGQAVAILRRWLDQKESAKA